jgi:metal-responsive CopG/Arc/MetJ family transcriptional regulator
MSTQISLKLSDKMFQAAKAFSDLKGFDNLQDFIREIIRQKLFDDENENIGGLYTYKASEKALAKNWLTAEEDKAWEYLQKEI